MGRRSSTGKADATGRTKTIDDHHVRLYGWFMKTPAWRSLTCAQRCVYIEIEARFFGANNGQIGFSTRSAATACAISKTTACKAFAVLVERGFIDCLTPGGFAKNSCKAPEWRLTRAPCNVTKEPASKRFMKWREAVPETAERSTNRGTVLYQNKDSRRLEWA